MTGRRKPARVYKAKAVLDMLAAGYHADQIKAAACVSDSYYRVIRSRYAPAFDELRTIHVRFELTRAQALWLSRKGGTLADVVKGCVIDAYEEEKAKCKKT
jgi:hypothetical protein